MGVRGLTTYIARNSEKYLESHNLHDTYLVIDGNNLAAQLYKWHTQCYDCFGGDYDIYSKAIRDFFAVLKKANVIPLVIFDGCYENKKLRTIYSRVLNRVKSTKKLNASTENSVQVFPLFLRELFTEIVISLECKVIRCDFEADYEMACIARALNCPVLSYDSDFFIFNVQYLPFNTFPVECKRIKKKENPYYAIPCKIYRIENFLNSLGGMDKSNLPLLAVLLGNDYIKMSVFRNFYSQLKLVKKKWAMNEGQRRIETVIKWLRNETYESAAKKILGRIKLAERKTVADQMKEVADGYICTESKTLHYFGIAPVASPQNSENTQIDLTLLPNECEDEVPIEDCEFDSDTPENNVDIGEIIPIEIDNLSEHFPAWFLQEYRSCNFPAWFLDIALHNRYFFIPQIENFDDVHSHDISLKLLAALHKILTSGKKPELTYIARDVNNIKNFQLPHSDLDLPTLEELADVKPEVCKDALHKILNLSVNIDELLVHFPSNMHIFILSIIFWIQVSHIPITNNHIYSLILSAITLNIVDKKVGLMRTLSSVSRYEKNLSTVCETDGITERDCINFLREVIPYFYMDEKMCRNPRIYDNLILDSFSRFQSCLFHIKYLNKILRNPYDDFLVSDFYNGTLIYGIYTNLIKREKPIAYLENVFSDAPGIWKKFKSLSEVIVEVMQTVDAKAVKRRRKRRNRNKSTEENLKMVCVEEDESDNVIDANNQYSILNFVSQ